MLLASKPIAKGADIACASSLGQPHPVFALWPITLASDLRKALIEKNNKSFTDLGATAIQGSANIKN